MLEDPAGRGLKRAPISAQSDQTQGLTSEADKSIERPHEPIFNDRQEQFGHEAHQQTERLEADRHHQVMAEVSIDQTVIETEAAEQYGKEAIAVVEAAEMFVSEVITGVHPVAEPSEVVAVHQVIIAQPAAVRVRVAETTAVQAAALEAEVVTEAIMNQPRI